MKTILAPVDFSDATGPVVAAAGDLARSCGGRVVLLHVIPPSATMTEFSPDLEDVALLVEKSTVRQLEHWQTQLRADGIEAEIIQDFGPTVPTLLDEAERLSPDYIVVGSHGHTALYDLLVGSTASGILRKAACPVVVVPGRKIKGAAPVPAAQTVGAKN